MFETNGRVFCGSPVFGVLQGAIVPRATRCRVLRGFVCVEGRVSLLCKAPKRGCPSPGRPMDARIKFFVLALQPCCSMHTKLRVAQYRVAHPVSVDSCPGDRIGWGGIPLSTKPLVVRDSSPCHAMPSPARFRVRGGKGKSPLQGSEARASEPREPDGRPNYILRAGLTAVLLHAHETSRSSVSRGTSCIRTFLSGRPDWVRRHPFIHKTARGAR